MSSPDSYPPGHSATTAPDPDQSGAIRPIVRIRPDTSSAHPQDPGDGAVEIQICKAAHIQVPPGRARTPSAHR